MNEQRNFYFNLIAVFMFVGIPNIFFAQDEPSINYYRNQISTNLLLPVFGSFDLSYERTIANKWAVGVGGSVYGDRFNRLSTTTTRFGDEFDTNYEITPFVRVYFQGAQNKSHFVELFGSLTRVDEAGRFLRSNNEEGFGVYNREIRSLSIGGLGAGYGYRFLLLDNKMVLEAQFGFRTNFDTEFIVLTGALVHTGIKIGYRF